MVGAPFAIGGPRKIPVPLKDEVKQVLQDMCVKDVIQPVSELSDWCAPLVRVPTRTGKTLLCSSSKYWRF